MDRIENPTPERSLPFRQTVKDKGRWGGEVRGLHTWWGGVEQSSMEGGTVGPPGGVSGHLFRTLPASPPPGDGSNPKPRKKRGRSPCSVEGCPRLSAGRGFCRVPGGGKWCSVAGCGKTDVGGGGTALAMGGARGARRRAARRGRRGGGKFCKLHGGGTRCSVEGCTSAAQSGPDKRCIRHGGGQRCTIEGCRSLVRRGRLCQKHFFAYEMQKLAAAEPTPAAPVHCHQPQDWHVWAPPGFVRVLPPRDGSFPPLDGALPHREYQRDPGGYRPMPLAGPMGGAAHGGPSKPRMPFHSYSRGGDVPAHVLHAALPGSSPPSGEVVAVHPVRRASGASKADDDASWSAQVDVPPPPYFVREVGGRLGHQVVVPPQYHLGPGVPHESQLMTYYYFHVPDMQRSEDCGVRVRHTLSMVPGVVAASVHFPTKTASVQSVASALAHELKAAISMAGFDSDLISTSTTHTEVPTVARPAMGAPHPPHHPEVLLRGNVVGEGEPLRTQSHHESLRDRVSLEGGSREVKAGAQPREVNPTWADPESLGIVNHGCHMVLGDECSCASTSCKCFTCDVHHHPTTVEEEGEGIQRHADELLGPSLLSQPSRTLAKDGSSGTTPGGLVPGGVASVP